MTAREPIRSRPWLRALQPLPDQATLADLDDVLDRVGLVPSAEALAL